MPLLPQFLKNTFFFIAAVLLINKSLHAQVGPEPPRGFMAGQPVGPAKASDKGLLFYLSGDKQFNADFAAGGQVQPNFLRDVKVVPNGAYGSAFEADDKQLMSYWAPGNIFSQRGTLSFFWRSRYPVGPTPFPVFRVGYADHSSWDMVWLRIDYNGAGFDAFVTDIGLSRTRVSHFVEALPKPDQWTHLALSWDETEGIRFYINGKLVQKQSMVGNVYDSGLDQFGPHSRIISPYQVQSEYNFVRGGDLDELRIYDRMLSDENISQLHKNIELTAVPELRRDLANPLWRNEWWTRHGWNLPNKAPEPLPSSNVTLRKVEVHEVEDVKRWNWKANDGIRETTWPGVYNMSRLPGRYDYFVLPDWDTYSVSGQTVKFILPNEPWNHVEVWGSAWGQLTYEDERAYDTTFGVRSQKQVKSYHALNQLKQGGKIRFDNALIEEPIGELGVYYIHNGKAPGSRASETFTLAPAPVSLTNKPLQDLAGFVNGRYPADERAKMVGVPQGGTNPGGAEPLPPDNLPFIHIMIPYTNRPGEGLDGVEMELPALPVQATHNGLFPVNIRVKDPLWPMRDMADISFSVKPNEAHTLWIDTRDRILPENHALYITVAGAGQDLVPGLLAGARIRLVYKPKEEARPEFELDRITQVRDLYGFTVEERPVSTRLNLANRFFADNDDLLKTNPGHFLGKAYNYVVSNDIKQRPEFKVPQKPAGVPEWAFLQVEYLRHLDRIVNYYIDNRQIANGEFGGGLSDDDDFTNMFAGTAFMGIAPEKTLKSLQLFMSAFYDNERDPYYASLKQPSLPLFTNGIATISTDLLHAYEEGIEAVGQMQIMDYGNPLHITHGMAVAKRVLEDITQINPAGHRHFRSRNYGGTRMSTEDPWQWSGYHSYHMLHTAYILARYNGNPKLKKMLTEIADGLLAHVDKDGNVYPEINFATDQVRGVPGGQNIWQIFMAAYDLTGDRKYLAPIPGKIQEVRKFNQDSLVARYSERIKDLGAREYINTVGTVWIDRVVAPDNDIQTDRLGGVALTRINNIYQQNYVSWKIDTPATYASLAFFVSRASPSNIEIIAYNLDKQLVNADMTVWDIKPGRWKIREGLDLNDDQVMDKGGKERLVRLERGESLRLAFAPGKHAIVQLELVEPAGTDYKERPDLGISPTDVKVKGNEVSVRVYSLGAINSPATTLVLKDSRGKIVAKAAVPSLKAPVELLPEWTEVKLAVPAGTNLASGSL
ncbi:MAG TPA: LamG-like jellyroll fold domain-containing protein, partial [Chitinophagaceae bacterium]|nr:LamG-like jellyroll fold domain-containing protein [Chitinophagaceae bacterium]